MCDLQDSYVERAQFQYGRVTPGLTDCSASSKSRSSCRCHGKKAGSLSAAFRMLEFDGSPGMEVACIIRGGVG
jgi:hypothetical protein